jgi:hypothetical protein
LVSIGNILGVDFQGDSYGTLTMGAGYLGLWLGNRGRVVFWDIQDLEKPEYLGTVAVRAAYPYEDEQGVLFPRRGERNYHSLSGPTTPYRREDGALGYLFGDRILWLEFPALMKEAKS